MQTVNIHDAKSQLSRLIEAVIGGEDVIIAKAGKPLVRMIPITPKPALRLGLMQGEISIRDDFDAPLPDDILAAFEGGPCDC